MLSRKLPKHKDQKIKYRRIYIQKKWIIIGLCMLIISFFINLVPILFLSFFCVANALLLSIDRYVNAPVDLEFSTFSAVLMTVNYGLRWGLAVAILTKVAAILYNKNITIDHFFMMGGYMIAGLIANTLPSMHIVLLGIIVTLIVNLYIVFVSKFITMLSNYEIIMYGSTNIIFNSVLFIGFSELFMKIMI